MSAISDDHALEALADRVAALVAARLGPSHGAWIGVREAADYLACKPQRIYDLVSQGRLPHRRDGRRVLFRRADLDRYLGGEIPPPRP
jgi:excisionase family DNA binding protein